MTDHRPYQPARSRSQAMDELVRERGRQFDPIVVNAAVACLARD
jgi:HD-GYP domain-containing protein (c-di-GMP phosphodiesterase class II)